LKTTHSKQIAVVAVAALLAACSSPSSVEEPGSIRLAVSTTGQDIDPDGYTYSLEGAVPTTVAINGQVVIPNLSAGNYELSFGGIAGNCQSLTPATATVAVLAGETTNVDLNVECEARLRIATSTAGPDADLYYILELDGGAGQLLSADGDTVAIPDLALGNHVVRIAGLASNCAISGDSLRTVTIGVDDLLTERVNVTCSATTRQVAFGSNRDGGYDLYVMNVDGSGTIRLTDGSTIAVRPQWSPNARKLVYQVAYQPFTTILGWHIVVMDADGSGVDTLIADGAFNEWPRWSPDGSRIAFEKAGTIWVMDRDGGNAIEVRSVGCRPTWSPDGNMIAFSADDGSGTEGVWVMRADGSGAMLLQSFPNAYSAQPVWSPDGTQILFQSPRDGGTDIYIMNADGTAVRNLTSSPGGTFNEDFDWSPDGMKIIFATNRDAGALDIYVMDSDGSNAADIMPNGMDGFAPAWRP